MIIHLPLPSEHTKSLLGLKPYKKGKMLNQLANEVESLFKEISHSIYLEINSRASFISFLNSFTVVKKDEGNIDFFIDEEFLGDNKIDIIENNFEKYLVTGEIQTKPVVQDEYINRINRLETDIHSNFNTYLSKEFWQDFKKEGR